MRRWNLVRAGLGGLAGFAGAGAWAVSLAVYQRLMEPADSGIAENNTYWPRDIRELGILLGAAAVLAIAGVTRWTLAVAGLLGVGWLGVDLWLDRVDFFDPGGVVWLTAAGCGAIILAGVLAAVISRSSTRGHYVVAATIAVLSTATSSCSPSADSWAPRSPESPPIRPSLAPTPMSPSP